MNRTKKLFAVIICLAMTLSVFVVYVPCSYAAEAFAGFSAGKYPDGLYETLYNGLMICSGRIDISSYNVSVDDIVWVYSSVIYNHPDLYFIDDSFGISKRSSKVVSLSPAYLYTGNRLESIRTEYEQTLNAIAAQFSGMDDFEAAAAVNDYITANYSYDHEGIESGNIVYDTYGMIKSGRAVCQGYSLLFLDIMNRLGIECEAVISSPMAHQWNIVKLGSSWYHVDVTWNDGNSAGDWHTNHNYFLLSDEGLADKDHNDWTVAKNQSFVCSDKKYDNFAWNDSDGELAVSNGMIYCVRNTDHGIDIIGTDMDGNSTVLFNKPGKWKVYTRPGYVYSESQSSAARYKNWLFFNTETELYCFDLEFGTVNDLCDLEPQNGYVYCVTDIGDKLIYSVSERPDTYINVRNYEINTGSVHYSGDTDGSGMIDATDVLSSSMALINGKDGVSFPDADGSGSFDSSDVLYIKQSILGIIHPYVAFN